MGDMKDVLGTRYHVFPWHQADLHATEEVSRWIIEAQ